MNLIKKFFMALLEAIHDIKQYKAKKFDSAA